MVLNDGGKSDAVVTTQCCSLKDGVRASDGCGAGTAVAVVAEAKDKIKSNLSNILYLVACPTTTVEDDGTIVFCVRVCVWSQLTVS